MAAAAMFPSHPEPSVYIIIYFLNRGLSCTMVSSVMVGMLMVISSFAPGLDPAGMIFFEFDWVEARSFGHVV